LFEYNVTDGLGYYDDGEEHLGVGEEAYDGMKATKLFKQI
jgi:hypothetical protein